MELGRGTSSFLGCFPFIWTQMEAEQVKCCWKDKGTLQRWNQIHWNVHSPEGRMPYDCLFFNQHLIYIWAIGFPNLLLSFQLIWVSVLGRKCKTLNPELWPRIVVQTIYWGAWTVLSHIYVSCLDVYFGHWLADSWVYRWKSEEWHLFNALL